MSRYPRFLDLYHAGLVTAEQIDDCIEQWHDAQTLVSLHVFLGMTWGEYRTWLTEHWLPSADEHAAETSDALWESYLDGEAQLLRVHPPMRCRPPCPIHWPSGHPLAGAPVWWDNAVGVLRRRCPHDRYHPDPDDQQVRLHPELAEHDCDGCCTARVVEGDFSEPVRTSGGVPLTDEVLERLAAEAEQGYDVAKLLPRRRGEIMGPQ